MNRAGGNDDSHYPRQSDAKSVRKYDVRKEHNHCCLLPQSLFVINSMKKTFVRMIKAVAAAAAVS